MISIEQILIEQAQQQLQDIDRINQTKQPIRSISCNCERHYE